MLMTILMSACATRVAVNVNAISDMERTQYGKKYFLTNVNNEVPSDDLYFKEFRRYFDYALQQKGYTKADSRDQADLEIQLHYGISDGRTGVQTYSWPIYETFGGESMTITEKVTDSGGQSRTVRRTIYVPATVRQVGNSYETRSYTIYNRYVNLAALPIDGDKKPVWNINVHSVGESSDLRAIMPYLAAAALPYLGENSGQEQQLELGPEDPVIKEMRSLTQKPQ
jgi:hypothetical protein